MSTDCLPTVQAQGEGTACDEEGWQTEPWPQEGTLGGVPHCLNSPPLRLVQMLLLGSLSCDTRATSTATSRQNGSHT